MTRYQLTLTTRAGQITTRLIVASNPAKAISIGIHMMSEIIGNCTISCKPCAPS